MVRQECAALSIIRGVRPWSCHAVGTCWRLWQAAFFFDESCRLSGSVSSLRLPGSPRPHSRPLHWCESQGVEILCCPEGILGGPADYTPRPADIAMTGDQLARRSRRSRATPHHHSGVYRDHRGGPVTTRRRSFTRDPTGVYRKVHPAINKSVYAAGDQIPVFHVGRLIFGIIICNDSNFSEPARIMASQGATALFIPTNNGPPWSGPTSGQRKERRHRSGDRQPRGGDPCRRGRSH